MIDLHGRQPEGTHRFMEAHHQEAADTESKARSKLSLEASHSLAAPNHHQSETNAKNEISDGARQVLNNTSLGLPGEDRVKPPAASPSNPAKPVRKPTKPAEPGALTPHPHEQKEATKAHGNGGDDIPSWFGTWAGLRNSEPYCKLHTCLPPALPEEATPPLTDDQRRAQEQFVWKYLDDLAFAQGHGAGTYGAHIRIFALPGDAEEARIIAKKWVKAHPKSNVEVVEDPDFQAWGLLQGSGDYWYDGPDSRMQFPTKDYARRFLSGK